MVTLVSIRSNRCSARFECLEAIIASRHDDNYHREQVENENSRFGIAG